MQEAEARVALQQIGRILIAPFPDPVHDAFLAELRTSVLQHLHHGFIKGLVLDLSSVELLDEHDFEMIKAVCDGAMLMGTCVVIAGMRPGVAAGITMMGLDASWVDSALTVETAMERLK